MFLRTWRFVTALLVALSMGLALTHLLELPAKMGYDGALWLTLTHTLYPAFATYGAVFEVGALLATLILVFLVRGRSPAFGWTVLAAACMVTTQAAFWVWVMPVNASVAGLTPQSLPADWTALRNQWEYTHAARAILQIIALAALTYATLAETPRKLSREPN